jgi:hypothetical protein
MQGLPLLATPLKFILHTTRVITIDSFRKGVACKTMVVYRIPLSNRTPKGNSLRSAAVTAVEQTVVHLQVILP